MHGIDFILKTFADRLNFIANMLIPQTHAANPELATIAKLISVNSVYFYGSVKNRLAFLRCNA